MCLAKPGPRCSRDSFLHWQKTSHHKEELLRTEKEATQNYYEAEKIARDNPSSKNVDLHKKWEIYLESVRSQLDTATQKETISRYVYYSSPEGLKKLEELKHQQSNIKTRRDGFFAEDGDWKTVTYPDYENIEISYFLNEAKSYREKQKELHDKVHVQLSTVQDKYYATELALKRSRAELAMVTTAAENANKDKQVAIEDVYYTRGERGAVQNLISSNRASLLMGIRQEYLTLYIQDVEEYRDSLATTIIP